LPDGERVLDNIKMDTEIYINYKFGIGSLKEIIGGNLEKIDSLDDLKIPKQKGSIILPKFIGVYQIENRFGEKHLMKKMLDETGNLTIFDLIGRYERINPDLICIGYDPTIFSKSLLDETFKNDVANRLKLIEYVDLPDFYEKDVPEPTKRIAKIKCEIDDSHDSVIGRDKELLEMARDEFGLTRHEAVELLLAKDFLNRPVQSDSIIICKIWRRKLHLLRCR